MQADEQAGGGARQAAAPLAAPGGDALPAAHRARLAESRRALLAAIGETDDLTLIRGVGNLGDELIASGTRRLLAGRRCREIALHDVASAAGDTALLAGGGAWCRAYHELMPRALGLAEERFRRVVVLPSSFDPAVEEVRTALARSARRGLTTVFAREAVSFAAIRGLCAAGLAHDAAFFADLAAYRDAIAGGGSGTLLAYRLDREARGEAPPAGNRDISTACSSLDEWLWTIARHAEVETDRAHVMIAAALLGKRVRFRPSAYHKLPALAAWALADFDVAEKPPRTGDLGGLTAPGRRPTRSPSSPAEREPARDAAADPLADLRRRLAAHGERSRAALAKPAGGPPRLTIAVLSRDRGELAANCLASLERAVATPYRLLVIDNASRPEEARRLAAAVAAHPGAELLRLESNLGCAGGRQLAVERAATEYLMFLDDDAEVFPGTVEHLVAALDGNPEALAVGANLVLPDGTVQLCGGTWEERDGVLHFAPLGRDLPFDDPRLGASGACRWLAGAAIALRRAALLAAPFDLAIGGYYEDNEWFYRQRDGEPGRFRRAVEALVLHHQELKSRGDLATALPFLASIAGFYRRHGEVLDGLFTFVPELTTADGRCDAGAGRLFLELLLARGPDWLLFEWTKGSLAPLFAGGLRGRQAAELAELRRQQAALDGELGEARRRAAALAAALEAARRERTETARALERIHRSRLWRTADLYWSARRTLAGWLSRRQAGRR